MSTTPLLPLLCGRESTQVFETLKLTKSKRPIQLAEHLERLAQAQQTLLASAPTKKQQKELLKSIRSLSNGAEGVRVDLLAGAGDSPISWNVLPRAHKSLLKLKRTGVTVVTATGSASPDAALPAQVKHTNRLSGVLARGEISSKTIFELLWRNKQGVLTEGSVSNLFIVRRGVLITPPTWVGLLQGTVREHVLKTARRLKINVQEVPFTRHELYTAQEAFLTNSLIDVMPIRKVDARAIGEKAPGPVTRKLMRAVLK